MAALALRVLDIAEAVRSITTCLEFNTLDKLITVLQLDESGRVCLKDSELWKELLALHFLGRIPEDLFFRALPKKHRVWPWTDNEVTCPELQEYFRTGDEREHFQRTVSVVRGDISKITEIQGTKIDGLAFPTNAYLTNHMVGAAAAMFKRAGKGLSDYVIAPTFRARRDVGDVVVTPAFDAGVKRLIHCVGPRYSQAQCFERLSVVYENVMHAALAEGLDCVAIASISTGALGVPPSLGAQFGLRAIQKFIRATHWNGKVAIVCFEERVLDAFEYQHACVLANFNVVPPFPDTAGEGWPMPR